jgi:hypothetical protein
MPTCRLPNVQAIRSRSERLRLRQLFGRRRRLVYLLFTKSETTVQAYFAEVSVQAISLRTDGIVRTITSWGIRLIALPMQVYAACPFRPRFASVVCDRMKLTQGQRSCRPTFGEIYHRRPNLRIMQASSQPTALPQFAPT